MVAVTLWISMRTIAAKKNITRAQSTFAGEPVQLHVIRKYSESRIQIIRFERQFGVVVYCYIAM